MRSAIFPNIACEERHILLAVFDFVSQKAAGVLVERKIGGRSNLWQNFL